MQCSDPSLFACLSRLTLNCRCWVFLLCGWLHFIQWEVLSANRITCTLERQLFLDTSHFISGCYASPYYHVISMVGFKEWIIRHFTVVSFLHISKLREHYDFELVRRDLSLSYIYKYNFLILFGLAENSETSDNASKVYLTSWRGKKCRLRSCRTD